MYNNAVDTSVNAVGVLQRQQDAYMESTAAHLEKLRTSADETYDILFDQNVVNGFADALSNVLTIFNGFLDGVGGGMGAITSLSAITANVFNKQISDGIFNQIANKQKDASNSESFKIVQEFVNKGPEKTGNKYLDEASENEIKNAKELLAISKNISTEEFNNLNIIREELALNQKLIANLQTQKDKNTTYEEVELNLKSQKNLVAEQYDIYKDLSKEIEKMQSLDRNIEEQDQVRAFSIASVLENIKQIREYNLITEEESLSLKDIYNNLLEDEELSEEEIEKLLKIQSKVLYEQIEKKRELMRELKLQKELEGGALEDSKNKVNKGQEELDEEKLKIARKKAIGDTVKGISSVVMLITTVTGAFKTINDKSLSLSKILLRLIPTLVTSLPMIVLNLDHIKNLVQNLAVSLAIVEPGAKASFGQLIAGVLGFKSALIPLGLTLGQFIAIIAAIGIAVKILIDIWEKDSIAMKKATEKAKELKNAYQETKVAADELKKIIDNYKNAKDTLSSATKDTIEYKTALIEANEQALELINNNKELAKYAKRNQDGLIEISDESLEKILDNQLEILTIKQSNWLKSEIDAQKATRVSQLTDFTRSNKVSKDIVNAIADYMRKNNISNLVQSDLSNIEELNNVTKDVVKSIENNIDAYSNISNSLNDTKNAQDSLTDAYLEAEYRLKHSDAETGKNGPVNTEDILNEKLFKVYTSPELKEEKINDYIDKYEQKHIDEYNKLLQNTPPGVYDNPESMDYHLTTKKGQRLSFLRGGVMDDAKAYAEMMGYDSNVEKKSLGSLYNAFVTPFTGRQEDFVFRKNGQEVETIKDIDILQKIAEQGVIQAGFNNADSKTPIILPKLDLLISSLDQNLPIENLRNLLASGGDLDKAGMSNEAANILSDNWSKISDAFSGTEEEIGFWNDLGFQNLTDYLNTIDTWLKDRKTKSDSEVIGQARLEKMQKDANSLEAQVLSDDLTSQNAESNDAFNSMVSSAKQLAQLFPELNIYAETFANTGLIGTETWTNALNTLQEKINSLKLSGLVEQSQDSIDNIQEMLANIANKPETEIQAVLNSDEFVDSLNDLLEKDYKIDVEIHAQAEQAFESFEAASQNLANQAQKIGEGFIVAASDIRELNKVFPGIIEGIKDVGDGTVQLNEEVVQSAITAANEEIAASARSTIGQLKHQADLLRGKQAIYQSMYEAALALSEGEGDAAENAAIIKEGFDRIETTNNQIKTDTETSNQQLVANDSNTQAGIMAANWNSAYQSAAKSAIAFAQTAVNANLSAQTGVLSGGLTSDFQVTYQGRNGQSSEAAKLAELKNLSEAENPNYSNLAISFKNAAEAIGKQVSDIEGMITQVGARTLELNKNLGNIGSGKGSGEKGGGKQGKDPEYIERLEDEADRYHDINLEIEKLNTNLSRLNKQQDKLYGSELIANLNEQLYILNQQKDAYQAKLDIAQEEAEQIRNNLAMQGVEFSNDGYISNYAYILQAKLNYLNSLIEKYNSMSAEEQQAFKDTIENAKQEYEDFKTQLENYDELISSTIPEIEDNIQDAIDKEIEINIKKFTMAVELRLEMGEAERDWNEFKRKVIDQIKKDDILGLAQSKLADFTSYYDTNETGIGAIQKLTEQVNDTMDQIDEIDNYGSSNVYGDNKAKAMEDLQKYTKELMSQLEDIEDLIDEIKESYLDMIDKAVEAFDKQIDQYEYINDLINHDVNVIGLLYGDKAYDKMDSYYKQIEKNNNQELDFLKKRTAYAKEMMDKEIDPKAREKWESEWMDSLSKLNDKVEDSLQNIIDKYSNAIKKTFDELNKKITNGKGLDYVNDEWNLINKNANQYLDTINRLYSIQDLENKFRESIDDTDSLSAQKKLNDLMNEQLGILKDKDKLTQYDVDRANKLYELALKEIALEEAQKNKSQMRLRRDSQGNYSYQFVSDEDSIAQARQDLLDAQNDLYNFDKEKYRNNLNDIYDIYKEFQEKLLKLYEDQTLTAEERAQKETLLVEQYGQLINGLVEQNETIKTNLRQSAFDSLALMYQIDVDNFRNMSAEEQDILMNSLIPQWDSGIQQMTDKFAGDGGFIPTCQEAFEKLKETTNEYQKSLDELASAAGIDFSIIADGYDKNIQLVRELLIVNDELINKYAQEIDAIQAVISQLNGLISQYKSAQQAAISATEAAYAFMQAQRDAAASSTGDGEEYYTKNKKSSVNQKEYNAPSISSSGGNSNSGGDKGSNVGINPSSQKQDDDNNHKYEIRSAKDGRILESKDGFIDYSSAKVAGLYKLQQLGGANNLNAPYLASVFDTGGYTGSWSGNEGKLAFLHQKELVLNPKDTGNILAAVNVVKDIAGVFNNINSNIINRMLGLVSGIISTSKEISTPVMDQNVSINATFPNVTQSNEIENAFNNLISRASQFAFRKR